MFACKTEEKVETEDNSLEELRKAIQEETTADLVNYEYICDHCQIGSDEAGMCPCGMKYEINPEFQPKID